MTIINTEKTRTDEVSRTENCRELRDSGVAVTILNLAQYAPFPQYLVRNRTNQPGQDIMFLAISTKRCVLVNVVFNNGAGGGDIT